MIEGMIVKFLTDVAVKEVIEEFIKRASAEGGLDAARRWLMEHPTISPFLKNPIIKKIIMDAAPEELQPILKGVLSNESIKELEKLSPEELQKKVEDEGWWNKFINNAKLFLSNMFEILDDPNTVNFLIPSLVGIGAAFNPGKPLDSPKAVKSVGASSNSKFRKVSQSKFVKVAQKTDDLMPKFDLSPNFKQQALQGYQKIMSSNASDREKSIMLNYLMNNLQNEVSPVLEYIKTYFPDIYSFYESQYK